MVSIDSNQDYNRKQIRVIIADDSIVFRRFLRDIFTDSPEIQIAGEAKNGIEALDLILRVAPDVILMDMEMPLMDGMTALQHLMIHCPTPTVMFSSLTREGTARAFDAIKSGAVDFVSKDLIYEENKQIVFANSLARKVVNAASMHLPPVEPISAMTENLVHVKSPENMLVFCEECGARNIITTTDNDTSQYTCSQCGDTLLIQQERYRRVVSMAVLAGGEDCIRNLLKVIPRFEQGFGSSLLVVLTVNESHVNQFAEYLDSISSIRVVRGKAGMTIEGGYCYVCAAVDRISLRAQSAQYSLQKANRLDAEIGGPIDLAISSVAMAFKRRGAATLLSSASLDGIRGMAHAIESNALPLILNPSECLSKMLVTTAMDNFRDVAVIDSEQGIVQQLIELHTLAQRDGSTT